MATDIPDKTINTYFYRIRGQYTILDRDLAALYHVKPKRIREVVRRNSERFPEDFVFRMDISEYENWKLQLATCKSLHHRMTYIPLCFTPLGVTMLACILKSKRSIDLNLNMVRVYTKIRELTNNAQDLLQPIPDLGSVDSNMNSEIAGKIIFPIQNFPLETENYYRLSIREFEVLNLLVAGLSYKMIAGKLNVTYHTVRAHMKKIYLKLHVASMTEAVAKAINQKLIPVQYTCILLNFY